MNCDAITTLPASTAPAPDPRSRVLLLGEDNPLSDLAEHALYPYPPTCSGARLRWILGLPEDDYLALHRANLCATGAWSMREARRRAELLAMDPSAPWRLIVLCGRKVADAFNYERPFFTAAIEPATAAWHEPIWLVSLPHPSGRVTLWNREEHRLRARDLLRELAPGVGWGAA
jgi:hypothetical protein